MSRLLQEMFGSKVLACVLPGIVLLSHWLGAPKITDDQPIALQTRRIAHKTTCPACQLALTPVLTLDSSPQAPDLSEASGVEVDSKGRFFVSNLDQSQVVVFGPDGKYVTAFGRKGNGPGEFGTTTFGIQKIRVTRGDSILVFSSPDIFTLFTPTFRHVRTLHLPSGSFPHFVVLPDGRILVTTNISSPERIGFPLHLFSPGGELIRSLGEDRVAITQNQRPLSWHAIDSPRDNQSVWLAREDYRLKHWRLDGTVLHDYEVHSVPWMPPPPPRPANADRFYRAPPRAHIRLGGVDPSGLIWLNAYIPAEVEGTRVVRYDHRLEIFDPQRGEVLISQPVNRNVFLIRGSDLAYSLAYNADGLLRITVLRPSLRRE